MYWFQTTSKILVWLLAALMPLQAIPNAACGCSARAKVTADAGETASQSTGRCSCSQQASPPSESPASTHSCCRRAASDVKRKYCDCGTGCQCKKDDSSPRPKQVPPAQRTPSIDLATGPLVIFYLERSDSEMMETEGRQVASLSGADRCILLCRFHL